MNKGTVVLVGAGCGSGLITVQGLNILKKADAVVYDDLIDPSLISECKAGARLIYVGKRRGKHSKTQQEINLILYECAEKYPITVRLKGGDSFVFGRGGEEIDALSQSGINCSLVPGVSSCVAVPETFGIPVTHRGLSRSFTVVTGSSADGTGENYKALAALDGTLVFLMGLSNIEKICRALLENGKDENTPAAILCGGFSADTKRINGTLKTISQRADEAFSPAVIVIGPTAEFDLCTEQKGELFGVSVALTGTDSFTARLYEKLKEAGAAVNRYAYLTLRKTTDCIPQSLDEFSVLVFTSPNGVDFFFEEMQQRRFDLRRLSSCKFAVIGKGTGERLTRHGFYPDLMPENFTAENLGRLLCKEAKKGEKLLILRASNGSKRLTEILNTAGLDFLDCHIYNTFTNEAVLSSLRCEEDYTVFASGSAVEAFFSSGHSLGKSKAVCIGTVTANKLKEYSGLPFLTAGEHTADGIIKAIKEDIICSDSDGFAHQSK